MPVNLLVNCQCRTTPVRGCRSSQPYRHMPGALLKSKSPGNTVRQAGLIQLPRRDDYILSPEPVVSLGHRRCLAPSVNYSYIEILNDDTLFQHGENQM